MKAIGLMFTSALFLLFSARAQAQEIILTRTDTDSLHSSFVTATKVIGFDVSTSGISRCTGITFKLRYSLANYVRFSGSAVEDLGKKVSSVVMQKLDSASGDGILYVGVLTGDSVGSAGYLNPKVIHLEFVVTQSVPASKNLEFSFDDAQAVVARDSSGHVIGEILSLSSTPVSYAIHSFIDVWPGDADNNGVVDTKDISAVGLYLDYGMPGSTMRSFRREPASTLWYSQPVLAWDSTVVTYADCDGNGTVTVTDMLVVPLNFGKTNSKARLNYDVPQLAFIDSEPVYPEGAVRVPVRVDSYMPFIGAAGKISWNSPAGELKVLLHCGTTSIEVNNGSDCRQWQIHRKMETQSYGSVPIAATRCTVDCQAAEASEGIGRPSSCRDLLRQPGLLVVKHPDCGVSGRTIQALGGD
jgi:hypothetical protein